ncbi:unnamed protein product, partial [Tilletia caries]
ERVSRTRTATTRLRSGLSSPIIQELSQDGIPRFPVFKGIAADKTKPKDAVVRSTRLRPDKAATVALTAATEASTEASSSGTQKTAPAKRQKK